MLRLFKPAFRKKYILVSFQLQIVCLYFVTLSAGVAVVAFAFTAYVPKYRCKIPNCDSQQLATYNNPHSGETFNFVKTAIGSLGDGKKSIGMIDSTAVTNILNKKTIFCNHGIIFFTEL